MKVTLIKPNIGRREHSLYVDEGRMEPLMLAVIAGLTPDDVEVVMYDDRMESLPYDDPTDLVAITVEIYTARRAYEISAEYRQRGIPVILGGMHPTLLPAEAARYADSIFLGDAESLWHQVIADVRLNKLKPVYKAPPGVGQYNRVMPRRDLFAGKGYLPISLMQYSRGCRFACSFCAVSKYFKRQHYIRKIDEVIEEIAEQGRNFIFFVDDNIASDIRSLKALCRELIPMKINWVSQASLDITQDAELMRLLADSGCRGNVIGFESITENSLRDARKASNLPGFSHYREEVKILREHGMQTWAAFTLGYDHDTIESIIETMKFARRNRFTFAAFNILMPYPNTPLYSQLKKQNRLLYNGNWWLHPQYRFNNAAFLPKQMSADELTDACHHIRKKFNTPLSLLYRFSDLKTNLRSLWCVATFWRYTTLYRKEVYKKHNMKFGLK